MIGKKLMAKKLLIGSVAGAILSARILTGCTEGMGSEGREGNPEGVTISRDIGGEAKGEHGSGESGRESNSEGSGGSEEDSGATLAPDATFDAVRGGARLIMNYDSASNTFIGTVENTTANTLTNVRVEVHLSDGTELGPTTPVDMAPGEVMNISLPSTPRSLTGWITHAEVGGGESGGEHSSGASGSERGGGEHGSGGERKGGG